MHLNTCIINKVIAGFLKTLSCVQVMTYRSLLEHVGMLGRTIDYLKVDIEGSEIEFLEQVLRAEPHLLYHVKQIGMEIHPSECQIIK